MKKLLVFFIISLVVTSTTNAQQDGQFTNYMYNTLTINPAYAGSRGALSIFGVHRSQWLGLEGAPRTNTFSVHTPIKNSNLGIGFSFMNDVIGPSEESALSIDFSYTIPTSETYKLAFGLRATAHSFLVNFNKLNIYNPGDVLAQYNVDNHYRPNFGLGAYWYSDKTYFGLSIPNILETSHFDKNQSNYSGASFGTEKMHYHFIAGHIVEIDSNILFKPALLAKLVSGAPLQLDASANFMFYEKITLGVAYRWDAAMSMLAGFQLTNDLFIGYGYDVETTKLSQYNSGSHEFFLRYEFTKNTKLNSKRFF